MNTRKGNGGVTPLILNLGTRRKWVIIFTPRTPPLPWQRSSGTLDCTFQRADKFRSLPWLEALTVQTLSESLNKHVIPALTNPRVFPQITPWLLSSALYSRWLRSSPSDSPLYKQHLWSMESAPLVQLAPNKPNYVYHTICLRIRPSYFNRCSTGMGKSEICFVREFSRITHGESIKFPTQKK
jgi:hypothetical protein